MGQKSGSSSSSTQKLDPWLKGQIEGNLETIQGLQPYEPYSADKAIAPTTPQMQGILGQMGQMGQQGAGLMNQGTQAMQGVAGMNPQQVGLNQGMMPDEISAGQADLDPFMNPYQSQVVDQTMQDLDRARQMSIVGGEDRALGAGAFGGSRHGIADSETNRAFADQAARTAGQLNQQGFNTALGAAQQQQGMEMGAQQANQGMQQNMAGMDLQAQQANQGAGLDAGRLQMLAGQGLLGAGQGMFGMGQTAAEYGQNQEQQRRDFDFQQYQQAFNDPRLLAQMEGSAIQGIPMMGTTTQTQPGGSKAGSAMGGALSGAAMGSQIMPGWGTAIGGGVGLLGGMFG